MLLSPESLKALLVKNRASLTKTAKAIGLTPQRVHQLMAAHGVKIQKTVTTAEDRKALKVQGR